MTKQTDKEFSMSSMNQKVEAVTAVLQANARQRRLTNRQELAEQAGRKLFNKGYKKSDTPIERYKLIEVLDRVASRSDGVLLPALVVHYQDSRPGRRFTDWARSAGVTTDHRQAVRDVFARFGDSYTASIFASPEPVADDDYDDFEEDDADYDDRDEGD
jgi:hypothetical protein